MLLLRMGKNSPDRKDKFKYARLLVEKNINIPQGCGRHIILQDGVYFCQASSSCHKGCTLKHSAFTERFTPIQLNAISLG